MSSSTGMIWMMLRKAREVSDVASAVPADPAVDLLCGCLCCRCVYMRAPGLMPLCVYVCVCFVCVCVRACASANLRLSLLPLRVHARTRAHDPMCVCVCMCVCAAVSAAAACTCAHLGSFLLCVCMCVYVCMKNGLQLSLLPL